MSISSERKAIICENGTRFSIIHTEPSSIGRCFGIAAVSESDPKDSAQVNNLFFTAEEAEAYCKLFAENEVCPITLSEVLENIFVL